MLMLGNTRGLKQKLFFSVLCSLCTSFVYAVTMNVSVGRMPSAHLRNSFHEIIVFVLDLDRVSFC